MKNNIHICFTVGNSYIKYLSVVISSICQNVANDECLFFYVLSNGDVTDTNKHKINKLKKIKNFQIQWIIINKDLFLNQGVNVMEHVTIETNYRFLISSLFSSLDKLLFLDADLVVNGSLLPLWSIDIKDYYMAARANEQPVEYTRALDIDDKIGYFNTGVMLCNLKKWRKDKIEEKLFFNAEKYKNVCKFLDQDILVTTLQNKLLPLGVEWNSLGYKEEFNEKTKILHWAGPDKPWLSLNSVGGECFWGYAKLTPYYKELYNDVINQQEASKKITIKRMLKYIKILLCNR